MLGFRGVWGVRGKMVDGPAGGGYGSDFRGGRSFDGVD